MSMCNWHSLRIIDRSGLHITFLSSIYHLDYNYNFICMLLFMYSSLRLSLTTTLTAFYLHSTHENLSQKCLPSTQKVLNLHWRIYLLQWDWHVCFALMVKSLSKALKSWRIICCHQLIYWKCFIVLSILQNWKMIEKSLNW